MNMNRRTYIQGLSAGLITLSGCSDIKRFIQDCHLDIIRTNVSDSQKNYVDPIVFTKLTPEEQNIFQIANEQNRYYACPPGSKALNSIVKSARDKISSQIDTYRKKNPDESDMVPPKYLSVAYLSWKSSYFKIEILVGDQVVS